MKACSPNSLRQWRVPHLLQIPQVTRTVVSPAVRQIHLNDLKPGYPPYAAIPYTGIFMTSWYAFNNLLRTSVIPVN